MGLGAWTSSCAVQLWEAVQTYSTYPSKVCKELMENRLLAPSKLFLLIFQTFTLKYHTDTHKSAACVYKMHLLQFLSNTICLWRRQLETLHWASKYTQPLTWSQSKLDLRNLLCIPHTPQPYWNHSILFRLNKNAPMLGPPWNCRAPCFCQEVEIVSPNFKNP